MKLSFRLFRFEIEFSFKKQPKSESKKCICITNKTQEVFDKKLELVSKEWNDMSSGDRKLILGIPISLDELKIKGLNK